MSELLLNALHATLVGHGIAAEREGGMIRAQDGLTLEPRVFPRGTVKSTTQVQVDFAIGSPRLNGVPFLDSFAGLGDTPENAEKNAFAKFLRGSFHVIAEALTVHQCDSRQVEWENWSGHPHSWRVCSGPLFLLAASEGSRIEGYAELLPRLSGMFGDSMSAGPHWMRVFLGALDGKHIGSEVLVDGEPWPAGQQLLAQNAWKYPAGFASLRHLLIALPHAV